MIWPIDARGICAILMAAGGLLLALRLRPRLARAAWLILLIAGLANALVLSLHETNLLNINVVHHYLGAKYSTTYGNFYKLINAAMERPQVSMRDLDHPPAMLRDDIRQQRAYYIDLMRESGVTFNPMVPLADLRSLAEETEVIQRESEGILKECLPEKQIESFRKDTRLAMASLGWERDITTDYGFNGSPLYVLVRHMDPTLYLTFGRWTALLNLALQIAAVFLLVWITGMVLNLDINSRVAMAALVFASWDFAGWALPGLIFAGLWLPVALAVLAMRHRKVAIAGTTIAWAGLIKLFPFILLLPAFMRLVSFRLLYRTDQKPKEASRWSLMLLLWCFLAVLVLGFAAMFSGRSWLDFLHKVMAQFQSEGYLLNSVSLSHGLLTLGIHDSPLPEILSLAALAVLAVMFLRGQDEDFMTSLPRRSLVLIAAGTWLAHTWFNYYTIAPLLLLPLLTHRYRIGAAASAIGMAIAFILPEFDDPQLLSHPLLHAMKLLPYLLIPAWLVAREFLAMDRLRNAKLISVLLISLCIAATVGEAMRHRAIRSLDESGGNYLDRGEAGKALESYRRLIKLAPRNAMAHMNEAIALAHLGEDQEASAEFTRAVALAPDSMVARQNYGRWLLKAGRFEEAIQQLEAARILAPYDDLILYDLARVFLKQGQKGKARILLARALELQPGSRAVHTLLREIDPH